MISPSSLLVRRDLIPLLFLELVTFLPFPFLILFLFLPLPSYYFLSLAWFPPERRQPLPITRHTSTLPFGALPGLASVLLAPLPKSVGPWSEPAAVRLSSALNLRSHANLHSSSSVQRSAHPKHPSQNSCSTGHSLPKTDLTPYLPTLSRHPQLKSSPPYSR